MRRHHGNAGTRLNGQPQLASSSLAATFGSVLPYATARRSRSFRSRAHSQLVVVGRTDCWLSALLFETGSAR